MISERLLGDSPGSPEPCWVIERPCLASHHVLQTSQRRGSAERTTEVGRGMYCREWLPSWLAQVRDSIPVEWALELRED